MEKEMTPPTNWPPQTRTEELAWIRYWRREEPITEKQLWFLVNSTKIDHETLLGLTKAKARVLIKKIKLDKEIEKAIQSGAYDPETNQWIF